MLKRVQHDECYLHMKPMILTAAALLALAACTQRDPVADNLQNADALPVSSTPEASPTGAPPANATANVAAPAAPAAGIPAALQGRWGLTPVDCTTSLGDAKGLLVVNSNELRFYESRAVPSTRKVCSLPVRNTARNSSIVSSM